MIYLFIFAKQEILASTYPGEKRPQLDYLSLFVWNVYFC